jgi:non-ribosomal peptide synthetase component F
MPVPTITSSADTTQVQRLESLLELGSRHFPSRNALTYYVDREPRHISYLDLWTRAHRVASALRPYLTHAHDVPFVTLFLPNGPNQVIAILATLISGAAFVPIALDAASVRCRAIFEQSESTLVITDSTQKICLDKLLTDSGLEHLNVLDMDKVDSAELHEAFTRAIYPTTDPAYVLFSSGTTGTYICMATETSCLRLNIVPGTPKGIVTSHAAVLSYCHASNQVFGATSRDKWLRAASYTFDVSIEELFVPVCSLFKVMAWCLYSPLAQAFRWCGDYNSA